MAAHYAMHDERVQAVGLLSPVTNLSLLAEFDGDASPLTRQLSLTNATNYAATLATKNIWGVIGDEDTRVYTDAFVATMRAVQCSGCAVRTSWGCSSCAARSAQQSFRVDHEPQGHTVPPSSSGGRPTFQALAEWMVSVSNSVKVNEESESESESESLTNK